MEDTYFEEDLEKEEDEATSEVGGTQVQFSDTVDTLGSGTGHSRVGHKKKKRPGELTTLIRFVTDSSV